MAKALLLVWSSPASEETSEEFDRWYNGTHIPQLKEQIPSIGTVNRYRLADTAQPVSGASSMPRFLTVYELENDDVETTNAVLQEASKSGRLDRTTTMDMAVDPPKLEWYVEHP